MLETSCSSEERRKCTSLTLVGRRPEERLRKWSRANPRSDTRELQRLASSLSGWNAARRRGRDALDSSDEEADSSSVASSDEDEDLASSKPDETSKNTPPPSEDLDLDYLAEEEQRSWGDGSSDEETSRSDDSEADSRVSWEELARFLKAPCGCAALMRRMRFQRRRSALRCVGLEVFRHLLSATRHALPRREVADALAQELSLQCSSSSRVGSRCKPVLRHYLDDLGGCGRDAAREVISAHAQLYKVLAQLLNDSLQEGMDLEEKSEGQEDTLLEEEARCSLQLALLHAHAVALAPRRSEVHQHTAREQSRPRGAGPKAKALPPQAAVQPRVFFPSAAQRAQSSPGLGTVPLVARLVGAVETRRAVNFSTFFFFWGIFFFERERVVLVGFASRGVFWSFRESSRMILERVCVRKNETEMEIRSCAGRAVWWRKRRLGTSRARAWPTSRPGLCGGRSRSCSRQARASQKTQASARVGTRCTILQAASHGGRCSIRACFEMCHKLSLSIIRRSRFHTHISMIWVRSL